MRKNPQTIEIYKEDMQQKMDRPIETRTISESATISLEFVIQEGTKGHYKIVRDGCNDYRQRSTIPNSIIMNSIFSQREWNVLLLPVMLSTYSGLYKQAKIL